jgi:hypothetical protein
MSLDNIKISEDQPDHYYRTEIPNVVFTLGLTPFEFIVYAQLKQIAGERGKCWSSMASLAKKCGIGEAKLKECLSSLSAIKGDINLIKITKRNKTDGSRDTNLIQILDVEANNE